MTPTFIDLDGVLVATVEQLALDHGKTLDGWPPSEYRVHIAWGMTHEEVWGHTDTIEWWANLPLYKHARWLVGYFSDPVFLTAPMGPSSYAGKAVWAKRHFPKVPLIIANDKHLISRPHARLIDDSEKNIVEWNRAGGRAVLWPRPWNSGHDDPSVALLGGLEDGTDFDPEIIAKWYWRSGL